MNQSERDNAINAKSVSYAVKNYLRIFRSITLLSEKYMGFESYVVYRAYNLMRVPGTYHHFKVNEECQRLFCDGYTESHKPSMLDNALPADSEIIAALFSGFLDINMAQVYGGKMPPHLLSSYDVGKV